MKYKNGFFQLIHKENGTYMRLFPPAKGGNKIVFDDVNEYIHRIKIEEYDIKGLHRTIEALKDEVVDFKIVNDTVYSEHEYMKIEVNKDKTEAKICFYPPSNTGRLMTREEILNDLEHKGIRHGIIERNIDLYLKARQFCTEFVVARATLPIQGKNAVITYHFSTQISSKPTIKEDGSVDFHRIDNINRIEAGDLLATLEPAEMGKPGIDVTGAPIKQAKVSVKTLKHGLNIRLSEDGTKMYSQVAGHVSLTEDKVFVSNTYEVPADVSTSTGDIEYDGNVYVKGNVITGFKVEAKGDIIVDGVVEGATLIAGGQIVLRRGIQGMNRGILHADGDIVTKFIENSEVYAGGSISTDAIMHSNVVAKGEVVSTGKRGLIIGGTVKSEENISMKVAGSTMGTKTILEIGMDPALLSEYKELDKQMVDMSEEIEKHDKVVGIYASKVKKGEKIPEDKMKQYLVAKKSIELLKENIENAEKRSAELREEMEKHSHGRIKVSDIAYPGVKVSITNTNYTVKGEMHRTQFIKDRALVKAVLL
ncbi:MAG: DUF342 domain-containing protein [Lachnospiraceae bacterium]|nr:DUF342 domain-containing protein [Lachnospiraceae bacterium]